MQVVVGATLIDGTGAPPVPDSAVVEDDLTGETRIAVVARSGLAVWVPVTLGASVPGWREVRAPALAAGALAAVGDHRDAWEGDLG